MQARLCSRVWNHLQIVSSLIGLQIRQYSELQLSLESELVPDEVRLELRG